MLPFFVSRNPKTHKRHKKSTKPKHDKALRLCVDTQENTKGTKTDRQPIEFVCFVCFVFLAHNPKPAPLLALNRICVFCVFSGFKQSTAAKFIKHHSFLWRAMWIVQRCAVPLAFRERAFRHIDHGTLA